MKHSGNKGIVDTNNDIIRQTQMKFTALFVAIITIVMVISMCIAWGASYSQRFDSLQAQMISEIRSVAVNEPELTIPDPFSNGTYSNGIGSGIEKENSDNSNPSATSTSGIVSKPKSNSLSNVVEEALENGTSIADAAINNKTTASNYQISIYHFTGIEPILISGADYIDKGALAAASLMEFNHDYEMVRNDSIGSFVMRADVYGEDYMAVSKTDNVDSYMMNLATTLATVGISCIILLGVIIYAMSFVVVRPMRNAWQEQKRFIADASHELRTPIAVMMSSSDAAMANNKIDSDSKKWFGIIKQQSESMAELVNDLLYLAASDDGRVHDEILETIDINTLIQQIGLQFQPVAFESNKTIEVSHEEKECLIKADRRKIERTISVLLDNAIKYGNKNTVIRLKLETVKKQAGKKQSKSGSVKITVESTGKPITREEATKIFDRFYRADKARTQGSGYGLGLSMAKSIIEHLNGTIECIPNGDISKFVIILPTVKKDN